MADGVAGARAPSEAVAVGDGAADANFAATAQRSTDQARANELLGVLASVVEPLGVELVDLELKPGLARVVVDRPGGINVEATAEVTKVVSRALDDHDPFPGRRYRLEVTSPGIERPLRTPAHFARVVGEIVSVRTISGEDGARRIQGRLLESDEDGVVLEQAGEPRRISYSDIDRARTVFEWGASPRPRSERGSPRGTGQSAKRIRRPRTVKG